jgi:hypothetical protein
VADPEEKLTFLEAKHKKAKKGEKEDIGKPKDHGKEDQGAAVKEGNNESGTVK